MESVDREWSRFLAAATNGPMTLDAPGSRIDSSNLGSVREIDIQPALSVHGRRFGRAGEFHARQNAAGPRIESHGHIGIAVERYSIMAHRIIDDAVR